MSCDWEGNRRPGVAWPCVNDLSGLSTYRLKIRETSTPPTLLTGYGTLYLYCALVSINEVNLRRARLALGWVTNDHVRVRLPVATLYFNM